MKRFGFVWLILTIWCTTAVAGDLVSTWKEVDGGTMTLAVRDTAHIRMDSTPDNYMLLSGKKVYVVVRENGRWTAMDMDQMSGIMKMFGDGSATAPSHTKTTYTDTGRIETIAGYTGNVYTAETRDAAGKTVDKGEVVFSKAVDIVRINEAWMSFASAMARIAGPELSKQLDSAARQAYQSGYGGILRVDNDLKLVSVKKSAIDDAYFKLPDGAVTSGVPKGPEEDVSGGESSNAVSDAAKDTAKDIGGAAADEAKSATVDEVREEVRGFFNKIFD